MKDAPNTDGTLKTKPSQPQQGGFFGNLVFNIIIPTLVLSYLSKPEYLGPAMGIVVALAFPIGYGIKDLISSGKINPFSVLGIISVSLTGGFSLMELDPKYIAIKEAAIPAIIGLAVLVSNRTQYPLVKTFILNEQLINIPLLNSALEAKNNLKAFERKVAQSSMIVAASFFLSATLNYILAKVLLVSPPGTSAYNEELGKMTALSYPVIVIPSMIVLFIALWFLFSQMKKLTGQDIETFLNDPQQSDSKP
ncbi:VC0807 family protein [Planctobacterium marinum]